MGAAELLGHPLNPGAQARQASVVRPNDVGLAILGAWAITVADVSFFGGASLNMLVVCNYASGVLY